MNRNHYMLLSAVMFLAAPVNGFFAVLGIILLVMYRKKTNEYIDNIEKDAQEKANNSLQAQKAEALKYCNDLKANAQISANQIITDAQATANEIVLEAQNRKNQLNSELAVYEQKYNELQNVQEQIEKLAASYENQKKKLADAKKLCKNSQEVIETYFYNSIPKENVTALAKIISDIDQIEPTITLKVNALDYPDLRKEFNRNQKLIKDITEKYVARYTLKTYAAIYKLMVLALSAELQNILYNLKYDKLASAIQSLNNMFEKYVNIATEGNQTISPTLLAFIGEIKGLYIEAVKIEYEYYVKREKAKEEQARLKEQMRQEAEERKILEAQKQQIIKEEGKYKTEIENISTQIQSSVDDEQSQLLKKRLAELEAQLAKVNDQKEEIINLQNGKAGYVYIISNLGSFGDKMFKIGMTRRINPQDRVDELGDASVPFKFDVHSFIFSEDAVSLEGALHKRLEKQRVNKINLRKEFFYSNIDELETLVNEIDPTAEFNRTMLAEQYKQSLTISENE